MIFNDKETAKAFRVSAQAALQEYTLKVLQDGAKYSSIILENETSANNAACSIVKQDLPPILALLLYRSGIVYASMDGEDPANSENMFPVSLFYDDDIDGSVGQAIQAAGGLSGGIVQGRIHT